MAQFASLEAVEESTRFFEGHLSLICSDSPFVFVCVDSPHKKWLTLSVGRSIEYVTKHVNIKFIATNFSYMATIQILERIRTLQKLTPSEFRLVDFLSHNAPQALFENVTSLAEKTQVSKATVVRFIAKLGYKNFKDFRRELLEDARGTIEALPKLYMLKKQELESTSNDILDTNIISVIRDLEFARATINRESFHRAAEIIHKKKGNLYACGYRTSYTLAQMFHIMIKRIHPSSFLIGPQIAMMPDMLLDVTAKDVLVAVFRYPFARQTFRIVKRFADAGAKILLITDSEISPLADQATIKIVVTSGGSSISRSFTAITAVLEALHLAVLRLSDQRTDERLEAATKLFQEFDTYCVKPKNLPSS